MITVQKKDVAKWLLMDYQANLYVIQEKLHFFELKYNQSWDSFEQQIKNSSREDFNKWDDYMEWKAYIKMEEEIKTKIKEVKYGYFEMA